MFSIVTRRPRTLIGLGAIAIVVLAGCTVSKQEAPGLSGPSEFGTSIVLSASPEVLVQDGQSQSVITATARDTAGHPIPGLAIRWDATASTTRVLPVSLSTLSTVTDANGRTSTVLTAPPQPTQAPGTPDEIIVLASPMMGSAADAVARSVTIQLQPPPGVLPQNTPPVARFSVEPKVGIINEPITFNAATTTDEGEPCLSRCTYLWNFGDGTTGAGMATTHVYATSNSLGFTVTLTVSDDRGGIGSTTGSVVVSTTAPVARFVIVPSVPQVGVEAMFDASTSTVGNGSAISQYSWNFGDGVIETTTTPTIGHVYTESRIYVVTLSVTAASTNGQTTSTASTAKTITVP